MHEQWHVILDPGSIIRLSSRNLAKAFALDGRKIHVHHCLTKTITAWPGAKKEDASSCTPLEYGVRGLGASLSNAGRA